MFTRWGNLRVGLALALLSLALIAAGCGGGSPSSASPSDSGSGEETSADFPNTKATVKIVTFGKEGSTAEREAANAVVVKSLETREAGEWIGQCATLNKTGMREIPGFPGVAGEVKECAKLLKKFASPVSATKKVREDQLQGSISVLRVKGEKGYALFHGKDGNDYALGLEKEGGAWKVSAVNTILLSAPEPSKDEGKDSGKSSAEESGAGSKVESVGSPKDKAASD
jgi:hypothetical protein